MYNISVDSAIRFRSQVFKIQTLIDGGMRLTLDLVTPVTPETIVALFDAKQPGVVLEVAAVPVLLSLTNGKDEADERPARSPIDVAGG